MHKTYTIRAALEVIANSRPVAPICVLVTQTYPELLKNHRHTGEPCPYEKGIVRVAERYGIIGASYGSVVERQYFREGIHDEDTPKDDYFKPLQLWNGKGEHVPNSRYLVRHIPSGDLYICFKPKQLPTTGEVVMGTDQWLNLADDKPVDPEALVDYLPLQDENKRQECEIKQYWRTICIENILEIRCQVKHVETGLSFGPFVIRQE